MSASEKSISSTLAEIHQGLMASHTVQRHRRQLAVTSSRLESKELTLQELSTLFTLLIEELRDRSSPSDVKLVQSLKDCQQIADSARDSQGFVLLTDLHASKVMEHISTALAGVRRAEALQQARHEKWQETVSVLLRNVIGSSSQMKELLATELTHVAKMTTATELRLSYQDFSGAASSLVPQLISVVSVSANLSHIDLEGCLLGTEAASEVISGAAHLQQLHTINLADNNLDMGFVDHFAEVVAQPMNFAGLRCVILSRNPAIEDDVLEDVDLLVANQHKAASNTKMVEAAWEAVATDEQHLVRVLSLDGMGMKGAVQVTALQLLQEQLNAGKFEVIAASSFSSVIAVALALRLPMDTVATFFANLAQNVFAHGHYIYYGTVGARALRSWWTGGDYFSSTALRQELETLLGSHAQASFRSIGRNQDIKLLLYTHALNIDEVRVFRSFKTSTTFPKAAVRDMETISTIDVLHACCMTTSFFAPYHPSGSNTPLTDALLNPTSLVLSECLQHCSLDQLCVTSLGCGARCGVDETSPANTLVLQAAARQAAEKAAAKNGAKSPEINDWVVALHQLGVHHTIAPLFQGFRRRCYVRHHLQINSSGVDISISEESSEVLQSAVSTDVVSAVMASEREQHQA